MRTISLPLAAPRRMLAGLWRLADPKIALASAIPFVVGAALAVDQRGHVSAGLAAAAFAAIFLVEVGKNAVNDLYDFECDCAVTREERSPFSGGKRTLVDALLTDHDLVLIAWIAFLAAGMIGLEIAARAQPLLFLLAATAAATSVLYAAPPVRLAARGLGELAVFAVYGPGIVIGAVLLLRGTITLEVIVASLSLGFLIANVLLMNEIPDERADRVTGKRTLVVRLGRDRAESLIALVFACAFALPLSLAAYGVVPFRMVTLVAGAPLAILASALLDRTPAGHPPVAAQALTLAAYAMAGLALAVAVAM